MTLAVITAVLCSGCSYVRGSKVEQYMYSQEMPLLEIPEGLTKPEPQLNMSFPRPSRQAYEADRQLGTPSDVPPKYE